jgi:hypothetical protein
MSDVDFLVCKVCDTPCYVFELDDADRVTNAFCQMCGNDDPAQFVLPNEEDMEPEA